MHNLVIIKIKKQYDGQAEKIINGLWGAGQMMFAKVIIVVDENTDIFNLAEVARVVSERVDVNKNIIHSKGPADILDHAAGNYAYHGKTGIDASCETVAAKGEVVIEKEKILSEFSFIKHVNDTLPGENISMVIIFIEKNKSGQIRDCADTLLAGNMVQGVKSLVFMDSQAASLDLGDIAWLALNNIDPARDVFVNNAVLVVDATRKTPDFDGFDRHWPNVIVSDDDTIRTVDEKWLTLGLGEFIESPSKKYKKLLWPGGAKAD
jgi:4-hydroxy-3-polyprenylbenzoate decarboxylase